MDDPVPMTFSRAIRYAIRTRQYRLQQIGNTWHLPVGDRHAVLTDPCAALRVQSLLNRVRLRHGSRMMTPRWYWALREQATHEQWARFCPVREARREARAFEASLSTPSPSTKYRLHLKTQGP